jgi:hypothetical protein
MQTNGVGANKYEITTNLHLLGSTPNWDKSICPVRSTCSNKYI